MSTLHISIIQAWISMAPSAHVVYLNAGLKLTLLYNSTFRGFVWKTTAENTVVLHLDMAHSTISLS